ncbi:Dihydrosphingosine phosphate lyase [Hypoxylon texense]
MPDTDSDADPDSSPHRPAPQTPTRNANAEHHPWSPHHDHDAFTPNKSSPSGSPSMSLHSLGMSTLSTMRRQLSAPFLRSPSSSLHLQDTEREEHEEIVRDSKDVLVQRLNDLAAQLSQQDYLEEGNVNGLHAKVDEMERVLSTRSDSSRRRTQRSRPTSMILQGSTSSRDSFWGPLTPGQIMPSIPNTTLPAMQSSSTQTTEESPMPSATGTETANKSRTSPVLANRVVKEAQNLCKELEAVAMSLRARQEESDARLFPAVERERKEGEMEMLNLQIQLKAIEVQCMSYIPEDADEDLRESISVWKTEWSTLKRKRARRKALADASDDPKTPMASTVQQPSTWVKASTSEDLEVPVTPTRSQRSKASPG